MPEGDFAGVTVLGELVGDVGFIWIIDFVFRVVGEVGEGRAGEFPAGPGAPLALIGAGLAEPVGVVLEVHSGIAQKCVGGSVSKDVHEGLVWQGPILENGLAAFEIRTPGPIEAEDRSSWKSLLPKVLSVLQAGQVEVGAALVLCESVERAPVHFGWGFG